MRRWVMLPLLLLPAIAPRAASITDATGRTVALPDRIARVLPAGPPAAVLMEVMAPDLMIGWPHPPSPDAMAWLPPLLRALPATPALTSRDDVSDQVTPLHPDLILDYGTVSPRYVSLDQGLQAKTGVPTILLDGALPQVPAVLRALGAVLGRHDRAEQLAVAAEAILAAAAADKLRPRVVFARGDDGLDVAAPGSPAVEVFTVLGWTVLAPDGDGVFRHASMAAIQALDPDVLVFQAPAMRDTVAGSAAWSSVRAVQQHHAYIAPGLPFGWAGEPPSINRLLGVAVLSGRPGTAETLANRFVTTFYGRAPDVDQRAAIRNAMEPIEPQ